MTIIETLLQFKGEIGIIIGAILVFSLNLFRENYQEKKKERKALRQLLMVISNNFSVFQENRKIYPENSAPETEISFPIYLIDIETFSSAKNSFYFSSLNEETIRKVYLAFNRLKEILVKRTGGNDCVSLTIDHLDTLITVTKNAKESLIKEMANKR